MRPIFRIFATRQRRIIVYFVIALSIVGVDYAYRYWSPDLTHETTHYVICSTATAAQTAEIGLVAEMVYSTYLDLIAPVFHNDGSHPRLKMKLYKDRKEFRRSNRGIGWAEAFYRPPYCHQYYPSGDANPYQWMVHEAIHQLGREVASLELTQWLDEGIAEYISTSRIIDNQIVLGQIDTNTYPTWWLSIMATAKNLEQDKQNVSFIPLQVIVSGRGGPDIDEHFNLYYVHWWTLSHFLFHYQQGRYRSGMMQMIERGGSPADFVECIGRVDEVERQWHAYVLDLKKRLRGKRTPAVKITTAAHIQN